MTVRLLRDLFRAGDSKGIDMEPQFLFEFVLPCPPVSQIAKNLRGELAALAIQPATFSRPQEKDSDARDRRARTGQPQGLGTLASFPGREKQAEVRACTSWREAQPIRPMERVIGGNHLRLSVRPRR